MDLRRFPPRSWLFVPALRSAEWLPKAVATGADAVIVDLEDATAPSERTRARRVVAGLGIEPRERPAVVVRVNASPPDLDEDIAAAVRSGADGVVLPKVQGPFQVRRCERFLDEAGAGKDVAICAMVETPRAVLRGLELVDASERLVALLFGGGDLSAEVGWRRTVEGKELALARSLLVLAAAGAGIAAVDTPWLDIADLEGLRAETSLVRDMGFSGKMAIHPSHVAPIHQAFAPSEAELAEARGLLEAFEASLAAGSGVTTYRGRMIDRPDALQAERVVARARLAR